jgi:superoxide dismutase, Cu-Zn family
VRRITKAALGGVAVCALVLGGTGLASGDVPIYYTYSEALVDLQQEEGPFDGATASVRIMQTSDNGTNFKLRVEDIASSAEGTEFGAHLHVGSCEEDDFGGKLAGPHYNDQMFPAGTLTDYSKAVKSAETEVWFDLVPDDNGITADSTLVPFIPVDLDGTMSIVIHAEQTNPDTGGAGPRQACLPLSAPTDWIYEPPATP